MLRLDVDPNLECCPDFASPTFQDSRNLLLSPSVDNAQAAITLRTIWSANNASLKTQWQLQLDADAVVSAEKERVLAEAETTRLAAQELQDGILAEEDRKKNRIHHIPIPDRPRPTRSAETFLVADFALRKIDKAQFVELYYWTNKGLADARLDFKTADDDSMVPTAAADGSTVWTAASAARPAAGVVADRLLTPWDFSRAAPRFIASLEDRGWTAGRVRMIANFFGAIMLHHYWTSDNPHEQRALLTYQEEQRRAWHQAIPQPQGAWNISIIDELEVSRCFDRIYHAERARADIAFDLKVRV
ncbi:hypothetical protein EV424DRAFT_1587643 [Suillus variegatus]|nr:hypothetical protein EV424DRAFT_1587643 [Suillus variegatus]